MPQVSVDTSIACVDAREILDSRGNPTVEVDVVLGDGSVGRAAVPSGASTGAHEAVELRDGDKARYGGKGVLTRRRQRHRAGSGRPSSASTPPTRPASIAALIELDGTPNKAALGANAILGVSLACAHAAAAALRPAALPLPRRRRGPDPARSRCSTSSTAASTPRTPRTSRSSWSCRSACRPSARRCAPAPRSSPRCARSSTTRATPPARATRAASRRPCHRTRPRVEVILRAIEARRLPARRGRRDRARPGDDRARRAGQRRATARRPATCWPREGRTLDSGEMIDLWADWVARYPIVSIEDGLAEDDWAGWTALDRAARRSRPARRRRPPGHEPGAHPARRSTERAANAVLIKLNQIGTLTETIDAIETRATAPAGRRSCRIAPARPRTRRSPTSSSRWAPGQIKTGAPSRSERVAKYNRLLRIEERARRWTPTISAGGARRSAASRVIDA